MGKRLIQQRRGKGTPSNKAPSHRYKCKVSYRSYDETEKKSYLRGEVMGFVDDPGHYALIMQVLYEDKSIAYLPAVEGIKVGDIVEVGVDARPVVGNVLPLAKIPEGFMINNIEKVPGDGGKFVRSPGGYAIIRSKENDKVVVELPSRRKLVLNGECRAQIGVIAGGGWKEKPLVKAGASYYKHKAMNRRWPVVRGVAMNAVAHPFGGKQHHPGKSKSVARNAPPGRKVGAIASRRTGRRKRK
ncbi:50S ribosomal protein L2 [Candidatus Micrarchaeota archaeon]|nr:50S ribosomal protein L2 [Candidatus Micrarchaeota archaeon]